MHSIHITKHTQFTYSLGYLVKQDHLALLHVIFEVVVNTGDEMCVKSSQGKKDWRGGGGTKGVNMPGEARPDTKCFIQKPMSLYNKDRIGSMCKSV